MTAIPTNYSPETNLLQDRIILVTGAGDGIGKVAAINYAAHGATVILLGRTVSKLEAVYDAIETAGNPQPAIFEMDMLTATVADYRGLADAIDQQFGRLDGLLHNASILGQRGPIETTQLRESLPQRQPHPPPKSS